jgi:hypothetical protein
MVSRELVASSCICCGGGNLEKSPAVLMPFVALRVFGHEPVEITEEWGLRDLRQGMAYTLCNSLQCQECGALFLDYRFTDKQMAALYHNYRDEVYTAQRTHFEPGFVNTRGHFDHRAAYLEEVEAWLSRRLPQAPAVLDWGGDTGINSLFRFDNKLLHIYDISGVDLVSSARAVDIEQAYHNYYDLVSCSQVLEHVAFPADLIKQMLPAVKDNTLLYLEVPNEALIRAHPHSKNLAPLKRHWHEHVNFFTETSMRRMLENAGLDLVDTLNLKVDLGWIQGEVLGFLARRK